ncbi:MAG: AAA family ATPase [Polyangiaceae bacterium]|nr:AAA family ATPase [Polyangiaceae bacterium]
MIHVEGYQITEGLGGAPAAEVYRARREADGRPVTLRALRADFTRIADIARFKHEYERIRRIASRRVARVHTVVDSGDRIVVVLDDVAGEPLSSAMRARGPLGPGDFLDLALLLAEGIEAVHQAGVVHGRLTPSSILIDLEGRPVIAGFGADAILTREDEAIYDERIIKETLPYMSPEATGRMNRGVDARADLYSLGVIFHELLTGRPPFAQADPMEIIHAHLAIAPGPPSHLAPGTPAALDDIVMKLLAKTAEDRYQTAAAVRADLDACRSRWLRDGRIEGLLVGQHETIDRLLIPEKLYGRADAIARLVAAFERVLGGAREIVLVSGYSGVGKSSLVQEILKPLAREKGYYLSGKFNQLSRDTPYSAILQALDGLVRALLCESEERLRRFREALRSTLGPNAQVLCEVIPSLRHVVGELPPAPALGPLEAQNRFRLTFQKLVSVFARREHPLALFLDDLQWADSASLDLIRALLADDASGALFFAGAYRDNEVGPAHPLLAALEELKRGSLAVTGIVLAPLARAHVIELLRDTLRAPRCDDLAEVVLEKTGGNPFFVRQFIRSLHERGVLRFEPGSGFRWGSREAMRALPHTANVLDLMADAIRRLPEGTQEMLQLGAAVGHRFHLTTLRTVGERSLEDAYAALAPALDAGLIQAAGEQLRFAHDKIQEAAYAMIPEERRAAFHLRIGRLLLPALDPADAQGLFDATGHLNSAGALVEDPGERLELARMNLAAAGKAEESAAFSAALSYLDHAIARLPGDAWRSERALSLDLWRKRGEMLSLCERHDEALDTLAVCLDHARTRLELMEVRRLRMNVYSLRNDLLAALDEGLSALRLHGIDLPRSPSDEAVAAEFAATRRMIGDRPIHALADLPRMEDPEIAALQGVLEEMLSPCYFVSPGNYRITVAKMVQNTLAYGISRGSIYAYVNFGMFLCVDGYIDDGYQFGQVAVRISELYPDSKSESMLCNMWGAFIQHWKEPYAQYGESFRRGVHAGLDTGQYVWAFYNATNVPTSSLLRGMDLNELIAEAATYLPVCKLDRTGGFTWIVRAVGQLAENLAAPREGGDVLKGEWVDIDAVRGAARAIGSRAALFFADLFDIILRVFQGSYAEAAEVARRAEHDMPSVVSWHGTPCYHFYGALALVLAADEAAPEARASDLARAEACAGRLAFYSSFFPDNLDHRRLLLLAEIARVRGEPAGDAYDEGIAAARRGRFVHDEALGNELCARHYHRLGKITIARGYMAEAHRLYTRWGAAAAAARLARGFPELFPVESGLGRAADPPAPLGGKPRPGAELDLHAALKAMQAIAGEIVLPRLLEALMQIVLESAGARRGVLVLLSDAGELVVEAEGSVEAREVVMLGSTPVDAREDLPASVLHYVARTGEPVVSGRGAEERFASDLYLASRRPRSFLAAPLLRRGRVAGILYVENDLAAFAFTEERVELLRMLSSPISIAIENAALYAGLERKVQERTGALEAAHREILALTAERQRRQEQDLEANRSLIARQDELITALSAPILQVWDGVLAVPVIGVMDSVRAGEVMQRLLEQLAATRAQRAIVDLTGVSVVDSVTAEHLVRIVRAVQLVGAQVIVTGIRPAVAQTITAQGLDLRGVETRRDLREALKLCIRQLAHS